MWRRLAARKRPPCVAPLGSPSARAARSRAPRTCRREARGERLFSPVTAEPSALPGGHPAREYVSDAARASRKARSMIFLGLHSRGLRASRVRNPVNRRRAVSFFVVSLASQKSQLRAMRQCAISSQSPKIGKMNTHSQKMTVNHCKKRYAFDKSFNPLGCFAFLGSARDSSATFPVRT